MKRTGIVRQIDNLGRLVIPMELRKTMNLNEGDKMEFYVDDGKIVIKPFVIACVFCGQAEDLVDHWDKKVCPKCLEEIKKK